MYVCYSRFVPGLSIAVDHDITDVEWQCTPAHTVISEARLLYYGAKVLQKIPPLP